MKNLRYMIIFPVLLIVTSAVAGWRCYDRAKADMVCDLNQALEQTVVSGGGQDDFIRQLQIPSLRDTACLSYRFASTREQGNEARGRQTARICSDTIMLAQRTADGTEIAIAMKAYANPTLASIFSYGEGAWPMLSCLAGILMLALMLVAQGLTPTSDIAKSNRMNLTPMQEQLMELFYASPSHTLSREEICSALWPRKDNPEDGLYTFISRMKSSLAGQSSLRIVNRRGREYALIDETDTSSR